jgi:hypothetical protein
MFSGELLLSRKRLFLVLSFAIKQMPWRYKKMLAGSIRKATSYHRLLSSLKRLWILPFLCVTLLSCTSPQNPPAPTPTSIPRQQVQLCGTVTNSASQDTISVRSSGECFWHAFQQCHTALLTYKDQTSGIHDFAIKSTGLHCEVFDTVHNTKGITSTNICSKVTAFRGGAGALMFTDCSHNGNITVPIDSSIQ